MRVREGSWERWYWPITVRRIFAWGSASRGDGRVVTMVTCGPRGWHRLLLFLHLPSLPHSSPQLHCTINLPCWSNQPCSIQPCRTQRGPSLGPSTCSAPLQQHRGHSTPAGFWGDRSAFGGDRGLTQTCPTGSRWKSIRKTNPHLNSGRNNWGIQSCPQLGQMSCWAGPMGCSEDQCHAVSG